MDGTNLIVVSENDGVFFFLETKNVFDEVQGGRHGVSLRLLFTREQRFFGILKHFSMSSQMIVNNFGNSGENRVRDDFFWGNVERSRRFKFPANGRRGEELLPF